MVTFVNIEDYNWIFNNKEVFRKYLMEYFDFKGKGLTHWNIKVESSKEWLLEFSLYKAPHLRKVDWLIFNTSGTNCTLTNLLRRVNIKDQLPKDLDSIKVESNDFFKHIMTLINRDIKIKEILNEF